MTWTNVSLGCTWHGTRVDVSTEEDCTIWCEVAGGGMCLCGLDTGAVLAYGQRTHCMAHISIKTPEITTEWRKEEKSLSFLK